MTLKRWSLGNRRNKRFWWVMQLFRITGTLWRQCEQTRHYYDFNWIHLLFTIFIAHESSPHLNDFLRKINLHRGCPWSHGCGQKKLSVSVAVPPAPVRVRSQRPLAPSVASVASNKGDNEMILGAAHRSPGICLTAEENPRKPQLLSLHND